MRLMVKSQSYDWKTITIVGFFCGDSQLMEYEHPPEKCSGEFHPLSTNDPWSNISKMLDGKKTPKILTKLTPNQKKNKLNIVNDVFLMFES